MPARLPKPLPLLRHVSSGAADRPLYKTRVKQKSPTPVASLIQFSGRTAFFALHPSAASMFVALALFGAAAASELPAKAMVLRGGGVSMPQTVIGLTGSALSLSGIATMLE